MRRSFSPITIMLFGTALLSLTIAAITARWCLKLRRDFEHELVTPLAEFDCDVSQPSEVRLSFPVRYMAGHGLELYAAGPKTIPTPKQSEKSSPVRSLEGQIITVFRPNADTPPGYPETSETSELSESFAECRPSEHGRFLATMPGSPPGDYTLTISINGASSTTDPRPIHFVVMNRVCGCELLATLYGWVLAGGSTLLSLASFGIGVLRVRGTCPNT